MTLNEQERALRLADQILDRPSGDPDDDLAVLARQLKRRTEQVIALSNVVKEIIEIDCDYGLDISDQERKKLLAATAEQIEANAIAAQELRAQLRTYREALTTGTTP